MAGLVERILAALGSAVHPIPPASGRYVLGKRILDLDDFKQLNDTKGHDAGDAALKATAGALLGALRSSDRVARLGGDEFAVPLPEIGYDAAIEAARKISIAVDNALLDFPPVRGSIGVAWFEDAHRTFPAMLKAADELMYEVKGKRQRRNAFTTLCRHKQVGHQSVELHHAATHNDCYGGNTRSSPSGRLRTRQLTTQSVRSRQS